MARDDTRAMLLAAALVCTATPALAQTYSVEDLARRAVERRAVEAVIWGMPAVNLDLMLQAMIGSAKGKPNQIVYWSRLPDWKNQTLTPNPDVIYLMPFFNTKDVGPMVLEIPPADDGVDHRHHHGRLAGAAGGCRAGRRRQGQGRQVSHPAAGLSGRRAGRLHRPALDDLSGLCAAALDPQERQRRRRRQGRRLRQADQALSARRRRPTRRRRPSSMRSTSSTTPRFRTTCASSSRSTASCRRSRGSTRDKADDRHAQVDRHREGQAVQSRCEDTGHSRERPRAKPTPGWIRRYEAIVHARISTGQPLGAAGVARDYRKASSDGFCRSATPIRSTAAASPSPSPSSRPSTSGRPVLPDDHQGQGRAALSTAATPIASRVPANAPVNQYWSATVYDRATHALIRDMPRSGRSSQSPGLQTNADGSVDIYFGPQAPAGKESNWVPTSAERTVRSAVPLLRPGKAAVRQDAGSSRTSRQIAAL